MFDPFQSQPGPGPLGNLPDALAATLNSSDGKHLYIPTGDQGQPLIQLPRPQTGWGYRAPGYRQPVDPGYVFPRQRLTTRDVGMLLIGLVAMCCVAAAVAGVALLFIR